MAKVRRKLTRKLILKSKEAFLLSLELFNKPTINYRAESFSMLFSNAWELLLKARLYESSKGKRNSIFRRKERNQKRTSYSLDECLRKIFENENDPVKRNIEYISEIRNEASHLVIQELFPYYSRAFQSGIMNYIKTLSDWFNINLNDNLNPGLVSLVTDKEFISDFKVLKKSYSKEDFDVLIGWIEKFSELQKLGEQGAIPIEYKIALVRNPKKADFVISSGASGNKNAIIVEKQRDPDTTHPFNRSRAIEIIKTKIPNNLTFNQYDFEAYCFVRNIKLSNNENYYKGVYSGAGQFSNAFIDSLVQSINSKSLKKWRLAYKQRSTKAKKRKV